MPVYVWAGVDGSGRETKGEIEARDEQTARLLLSRKKIRIKKLKTKPKDLFENISFHILGPGFYSLFGFSGCGKSSLARIIAGYLEPKSGSISITGLDNILLSYNTERLPGWLSVAEHLAKVVSPRSSDAELEYLVSEFGLSDYVNKKFFRLSMGQKNRANLIRYLVQDFDMLICDEVLANVDEPSRNHILALMKEDFGKDKVLFYISHNVEEVCLFSKKVFVIPAHGVTKGRLVEIEGLDLTKEHKEGQVNEKALQKTILKVLKAASTGPNQEDKM